MSGKYKGVQQALSELVERLIIYTACLPHGSNLAIEHGSNASRIISYMYDTLEALYVFFPPSTKRNSVLSKKLKDAESHLRLTNLSKTDRAPDQRQLKLFGQVTNKFVVALKKSPVMNALTKRVELKMGVKLKHLAFS